MDNDEALSFRTPLAVCEAIYFENEGYYPVCPQCHISLEREYQCFCDRCGQALNWRGYAQALHEIIHNIK